ncbi:RDD family protein [Massilia cavernae]|uniref:RDD family protein n=1 Tax=Massilia cavernae TaxID=2320864 RepID=A0A418XFK4_9BURK|nr:RDD family protein [Massilia cavernae]RJG11242.1 RDD family protein [Massilia cavernae]
MQNSKPIVETPTLKHRFICLIYDVLLLTAVVMLALFVFLFATQKLQGGHVQEYGRQAMLFLATGAYFIHSWTGSGHTLAMKTWRIKLVKLGHATVPFKTALLRYVLAWGWVFPALVVCYVFGLTSKGQVSAAIAVNVVLWGMTALLDRNRQFLHDRLAGTRLVQLPKPVKAPKAKVPA